MRGDTLLVRGNEIEGDEPLAEGHITPLEDGADSGREVMLAFVAAVASVNSLGAMVLTAVGANHVIAPTRLSESVLAGVFIVEVVDYRYEAVEIAEIHTICPFL